jgi:lauroyl/myristoyl acyltransferase
VTENAVCSRLVGPGRAGKPRNRGTFIRHRWWNSAHEFFSDVSAIVYYTVLWLISRLPLHRALRTAIYIGRIKYRCQRARSADLRSEIAATIGIDAEQAAEIEARSYEIKLWDDVETWFYNHLDAQTISRFISLHGLQNLNLALKEGKGAILCAAHVRGIFALFVALDLLGYKVNAVRRAPKNVQGPIARRLNQRRTLITSERCKFLWMQPSNLGIALKAEKALRRNEIVLMLIDSRFPTEAIKARFLNRQVPLPSGHAVLARSTGAPLLNCFVHSPRSGLPRIVEIGSAQYVGEDVGAAVQSCISRLEEKIRKYPADWIWFAERGLWSKPTPTARRVSGTDQRHSTFQVHKSK